MGARRHNIKVDPYDESKVTPVAGIVYKVSKMVSVYRCYIQGLVQCDTAPATSGATPIANAGQVFAP